MDRDLEIERARNTTTAAKLEQSPVSEAMDRNSELISAIEKQVEVLAARLEHVSSSEPSAPGDSKSLSPRGNSSLANRIHSQGSQLSDISDRLSYITRILEV